LVRKKYEWNTDQTGAVGRFSLTGFGDLLSQLPDSVELFEKAYREGKTLAQAVQMYVHALFGADGLLCLDADDVRLKQEFVSVMKADLFGHAHQALVDEKIPSWNPSATKPKFMPAKSISFT